MLSLLRLTIQDFGPYRGLQEMTFPRDHGVYIVYGPNGRGKTTLHNAFRYALYGQILGRHHTEHARELANSEARKQAGYGSFETTLDFEHDGDQYRLVRRYDETEQPHELMLLERNGMPMSQDDAEKALQAVAPRSVSQFFLFDGELLRQYENLLEPDSEEGVALEQAIERVLGIPIVGNAEADVTEVWHQAEKQVAEQYAAHDATRRMGLSLNEAQDVRQRMQDAHDQLAQRIDTAKERVAELEAMLREQHKAERLLGSLDQLRTQESDLKLREQTAATALNELMPELWKAVLSQSATGRLTAIDAEVQAAEADLRGAAAAARDLTHLHHQPDCPVCHRDLPNDLRKELVISLETAASGSHHEAMQERLAHARHKQATLQRLTRQDARLVTERDRALRSLRLERQGVKEEIASIERQLSEIGEDKVRSLTNERDERQAQILRDKERLEHSSIELRGQEVDIEALKLQLSKQSVRPDHTVELKDQVSQELKGLFGGAIDAYRAKLRRRVEEHASAIFRELTDEPDYVGLRITDRYGLEIIDTDGETVRRSAGYEHLVALSLIAALQDSAAVRGPVVMDYPFGRLDTHNTARVVAALPRMARQVILLSFDGEFDRQAALRALGSNLIAEFELERVTSKHTRILPRRTI
ncbi:AAA family ATPase [Segeticoccus rhizosphaerae]|uniref:AAA family ATPase n=1 Tax=Segeticoccus rhizosphaerae TaxID=1104777 RepID=UPI001263EAC7|nr:AAA family ATPase [Segeticoccus rhizosphaerae]